MNEKFLFDTSAVRSISFENLERLIDNDYVLLVSPYSFWELLCHLEEKQKFDRFKSELAKFKYFSILDDPFGITAKYTKLHKSVMQDRIEDHELIQGTISVLEKSSSIDEFYSSKFIDSKNNRREIRNCVKRGRTILADASNSYREFITKVIDSIKCNNSKHETEHDRHDLILSLVDGFARSIETQGGNRSEFKTNLINEIYVYCSFILHRSLEYLKKGNLNIDKNDYEDSRICQHLSLISDLALITNDQKFYNAVNSTICLLKTLNDKDFFTSLKVEKSDYLNKILA